MGSNYYIDYPQDAGDALGEDELDDFANERGADVLGGTQGGEYMPDNDPLLEAPTALSWLRAEPALIIGAIIAGLTALLGLLNDGFQVADLIPALIAFLGALGIRTQVFSQDTVDKLAPRSKQREVAKR